MLNSGAGGATEPGGIRVLGVLPAPLTPTGSSVPMNILAVTQKPRRVVAGYFVVGEGWRLRSYDAARPLPRLIADVPVDLGETSKLSGAQTTLDEATGRLTLLEPTARGVSLHQIDVATLRNVRKLTADLPGFIGYGITYSAADQRFYIVGDFFVGQLSLYGIGSFEGARPAWVSGVIALDSKTGALVWARPVFQCQQPLVSHSTGAVIARSAHRPVLYFACMRTSLYPGSTGLVRLALKKNATMTTAMEQRADFFPISGTYTSNEGILGTAAFDPVAERFFIQSLAKATLGAWEFDGKTSTWTGNIASPHPGFFLGVSPVTGHVLIAGNGANAGENYLLVSDGRATPAAQGDIFSFDQGSGQTEILTDPIGRRFFFAAELQRYGYPVGQKGFVVAEDNTPDALPPQVIDWDSLTANIPEGPGTHAAFAGGSNGFGSRLLWVGGPGGVISLAKGSSLSTVGDTRTGISPGDRGVFAARVSSLDLRNVDASVSAQPLAPDIETDNERRAKQDSARRSTAEHGRDQGETVDTDTGGKLGAANQGEAAGSAVSGSASQAQGPAASLLDWPWGYATCLDGSGEKIESDGSGPLGSAHGECDLKGSSVRAESHFGGMTNSVAAGSLTVGASSFEASSVKDPIQGLVTNATAEARGVRVAVTGVGSISIHSVTSKATTIAHGRAGSASRKLVRVIEGVVIRDAGNAVRYACAENCDLQKFSEQANLLFESHLRVSVPDVDSEATPLGAFAGIQKTDRDYYNALTINNDDTRSVSALEITFINDTVEKSRVLLQLASIQATSIYGISVGATDGVVDAPGNSVVGGVQIPGGNGVGGPVPSPVPPPPAVQGGIVTRAVHAAMFLLRRPGEGLLVGVVWLLFAGAGGVISRRRKLTELLGE
jgi:hypothetical protein